jgi:hypothetical protein
VKIISCCGYSGPPAKTRKTLFGWKAHYVPRRQQAIEIAPETDAEKHTTPVTKEETGRELFIFE